MRALVKLGSRSRQIAMIRRPAILSPNFSPKRNIVYTTAVLQKPRLAEKSAEKSTKVYNPLDTEPERPRVTAAVFNQLTDVANMVDELRQTNKTQEKQSIIARYPHLREVLETALKPSTRFFVSEETFVHDYRLPHNAYNKVIQIILEEKDGEKRDASERRETLLGLLNKLAERKITGYAAYEAIGLFLHRHVQLVVGPSDREWVYGIDNGVSRQGFNRFDKVEFRNLPMRRAEDAFWLLAERDLKAGVGSNTLEGVEWPESDSSSKGKGRLSPGSSPASSAKTTALSPSSLNVTSHGTGYSINSGLSTTTGKSAKARRSGSQTIITGKSVALGLKSFKCALGTTIAPDQFKDLQKRAARWYASRKLDGIRVLALLDFYIPNDTSAPITFDEAQFVSRTGNAFRSLAKLEEQLVHIVKYPNLREMLEVDPVLVEERDDGVVKRLVLDGEVCVMVKAGPQSIRISDDGTGASALWENDGLVENFTDAVSMVKRHATMENPMYFLFDTLCWAEVNAQAAIPDHHGLGKTFGQRAETTKELTEWLRKEIKEELREEPKVRALVQWSMEPGDVDGMMERAMNEGWEGLIFRADLPYKGTRSVDIRKFKKLQDAEYTVVDLETSTQRLPVDGVYDFYEAMKNVWIEHEGHRVAVGSGFTPKERIQFAKDPSLIVGKQITVEYFSESESAKRESGTSLRFPRVKVVWNEGKRTI